ncbi:MAG: hypothetical protein PHN82_11370 [bacterium]|nr:hypothetical protein [bacterium]
MKRHLLAASIALLLSAAPASAVARGGAPWFGSSEEDYRAMERRAGASVRVKARFAGLAAEQRRQRLAFTVETAAGELACEIPSRDEGAALVRGMQPGTPVVMEGRIDAKRRLLRVGTIVQGWGRDQVGGGG